MFLSGNAMSYINDALRKAQKENQIDSAYLNNMLPPGANELKKSPVRVLAAGLVIVLLLTGVVLAAFYWKGEKAGSSGCCGGSCTGCRKKHRETGTFCFTASSTTGSVNGCTCSFTCISEDA